MSSSNGKRKTSDKQPKLKLYYFDIVGKGEPIRLLCAYGGLELEDYRFESRHVFNEMKKKGEFPFGQVPLLEVDGGDGKKVGLVQSGAILRYLGRLAGSYPEDDPLLAAKIDAILAQENDAFTGSTVVTYGPRFGITLDDEAVSQSEKLIAEEVTPRHLKAVEKLLEDSSTGWLAGTEEPSPADFVWYVRLAVYMPSQPRFFPEKLVSFEDFPKIKAFVEKFAGLDAINEYYAEKK